MTPHTRGGRHEKSDLRRVLQATGLLRPSGRPAPGLTLADDSEADKLHVVFRNDRVGLNADAAFAAQGVPTSIFKDAGHALPGEKNIRVWHDPKRSHTVIE